MVLLLVIDRNYFNLSTAIILALFFIIIIIRSSKIENGETKPSFILRVVSF